MVKNPGLTASTLESTGKLVRCFAAVLGLCIAIFSQSVVALGSPATRIARDTFSIGGQSVSVTVSVGMSDNGTAVINETFHNASASFVHHCSIETVPGAGASRTVDDVALSPLGLSYTLHLTLALRGEAIYIEHALLLPGGVPLK